MFCRNPNTMASYLNKNLFLFTSILLKQTTFLKAKDSRVQTEMFNCMSTKLTFAKFGDPKKVIQIEDENLSSPQGNEVSKGYILS